MMTPEERALLDFIAAGEGGYESMNNGTKDGAIVGSTHDAKTVMGKPLSEMTIGEAKEEQAKTRNVDRKMFTVGRYQVTPETMLAAQEAAGLSDDDKLTPENQDQLGLGLLRGSKRPALASYIRGDSTDLDAAMTELAQEWASVPVPKDMTVRRGGKDVQIKAGESYYGNGNKSAHSVDAVRDTMLKFQETRKNQSVESSVASFMGEPDPHADPREVDRAVDSFMNAGSAPDRTPEARHRAHTQAAISAPSISGQVVIKDAQLDTPRDNRALPTSPRPQDRGGLFGGSVERAATLANRTDLFDDIGEPTRERTAESKADPLVSGPADAGGAFRRGFQSGVTGIGSDYSYLQAAGKTVFGLEKSASADIVNARNLETQAGTIMEGMEGLDQFLDQPTFSGFINQIASTTGQVAPSVGSTIASALVTGGVGSVAAISGKVAMERGGSAIAREVIWGAVTKSMRGQSLDEVEQTLVDAVYNDYRKTALGGFKKGALTGASAQEYTLMSGGSFAELDEAGVDLTPDRAVEAFMMGVPLTAIGVGGEFVVANSVFKLIRRKAIKQPRSVYAAYLQDVAKATGKSSIAEGLSELSQEALLIAQRREADPDYSYEDQQLRLAQAAFAGFVAGGGAAGAGSAVTGIPNLVRGTADDVTGAAKDFAEKNPGLIKKTREGVESASADMQAIFSLSRKMVASKAEALGNKVGVKVDFGSSKTPDPTQPTPEAVADIKAQLDATLDKASNKRAVWLPETASVDIKEAVDAPNEVVRTKNGFAAHIPGKGTIFSPELSVVNDVLDGKANDEVLAAALGYSGTKPDDADRVVRVTRKSDGATIHEELTDALGASAAVKAAQGIATPRDVVDMVPMNTALADREARVAKEKPKEKAPQGAEEAPASDTKNMSEDVRFDNPIGTPDELNIEESVQSSRPLQNADEIGDYKMAEPGQRQDTFDEVIQKIYAHENMEPEIFADFVKYYDVMSDGLAKRAERMLDEGLHQPMIRETEDGYLTLYAVPKDAQGKSFWQAEEIKRARKSIISAAKHDVNNPTTVRARMIVDNTSRVSKPSDPEGTAPKKAGKVYSPSLAQITAGGIKLNFLEGEALIGENMSTAQVARSGLRRAMKELEDEGIELGFASTPDSNSLEQGFAVLTLTKRDVTGKNARNANIPLMRKKGVTLAHTVTARDPRPIESDLAETRLATEARRAIKAVERKSRRLQGQIRRERLEFLNKLMGDGIAETSVMRMMDDWDAQQAEFVKQENDLYIADAVARIDSKNKRDNFDPDDIESMTTDLTDTGDSDASAQDDAFKSTDYAGERMDRVLDDPKGTKPVRRTVKRDGVTISKEYQRQDVPFYEAAQRDFNFLSKKREQLRGDRDDAIKRLKAFVKLEGVIGKKAENRAELRERITSIGRAIGAVEREMAGVEATVDLSYDPEDIGGPIANRFTPDKKGTVSRVITETPGARVAPELRELEKWSHSDKNKMVFNERTNTYEQVKTRGDNVSPPDLVSVIKLGKDLPAPVRRVVGIAKKYFNVKAPLAIYTYTDLISRFGEIFGDGSSEQAIKAMYELEKMDSAKNPSQGALIPGRVNVIILNDMVGNTQGMRDHVMATVLAHEFGHVVYAQELSNLRDPDNAEQLAELKRAFMREAKGTRLDASQYTYDELGRVEAKWIKGTKADVSQYTHDWLGFEEWYADQVTATIAKMAGRGTEGLRTDINSKGREVIHNDVSEGTRNYFTQIARKFVNFFRAINVAFKNRFDRNEVFSVYMDGVLDAYRMDRLGAANPQGPTLSPREAAEVRAKLMKSYVLIRNLESDVKIAVKEGDTDAAKTLRKRISKGHEVIAGLEKQLEGTQRPTKLAPLQINGVKNMAETVTAEDKKKRVDDLREKLKAYGALLHELEKELDDEYVKAEPFEAKSQEIVELERRIDNGVGLINETQVQLAFAEALTPTQPEVTAEEGTNAEPADNEIDTPEEKGRSEADPVIVTPELQALADEAAALEDKADTEDGVILGLEATLDGLVEQITKAARPAAKVMNSREFESLAMKKEEAKTYKSGKWKLEWVEENNRRTPTQIKAINEALEEAKPLLEKLHTLRTELKRRKKAAEETRADLNKVISESYVEPVKPADPPAATRDEEVGAVKAMVSKLFGNKKDVEIAIELKDGTTRTLAGNPNDLKKWLARHLTASDDWLRARGEPGTRLAQFFYGRSQSKDARGFHMDKTQAQNRLVNMLGEALGGDITEKDLMHGSIRDAMLRAEDDTVPTAALDDEARKIREIFEYINDKYITQKGERILKFTPRKNYFHRLVNPAAVRANPAGFVDFLVENGTDKEYALQAVKKILRLDLEPAELTIERILAEVGAPLSAEVAAGLIDELHGGQGFEPSAAGVKRRGLAHIPTKSMRNDKRGNPQYGWLVHPSQAMLLYFHHITKLVEFQKRGGTITNVVGSGTEATVIRKELKGSEYVDALIAQMPEEDQKHARMAVKANLGQLGHERVVVFGKDITDAAHTANSIAATHTVITTLLFSVFASLPDFAAVALRTKDAKHLGETFRQFGRTLTQKENAALARAAGIVTNEVVDNAFMSAGEMDFVQRPFKKVISGFFKWTGTEAYTKMMRTFAAGMGREFLIYTANDSEFGPRQKRYLDELQITRERVKEWDAAGRPLDDSYRDVLDAIARFADEAVLRPNASQRPIWASNPWFLAVWQLKSYFYAYGKTVLSGLGREMKAKYKENDGSINESVALLLLAAGLIFPLTMLGLEAREYTKWWGRYINPFQEANDSVFRTNNMDPAEYALEIGDRSGIMGPYALAYSTYKGMQREGVLFGPVISNVPALDAIDDSVNDGDYGRLIPVVNNL